MLPPESAPLLYRELVKIADHPAWSPREQVLALAGLMERIFFEATKQEQIAFSTLFARISYAGHKCNFQENVLRSIHRFRLAAKWVRNGSPANEQTVQLGLRAVAETVQVLTGVAIPQEIIELLGGSLFASEPGRNESELTFASVVRVVALEDKPEHNYFIASDEENPNRLVRVLYGLPERNENFMPSIQIIRKVFGFPVTLNLLDVEMDADGNYRPRAFVVEPDYLVDVSAIAECFKETGADPYSYLVKKFLPHETTEPILLGNIANFFLDRLLNEPAAEWATVFRETFQLYPFVYAPMSDAEVKSVSGKAQKHFLNLKNMAANGLAKEGIEPENCFLEPAFFSEQYGIQGRLDLFYRSDEKAAIVELKSGTPFKPNSYGIQRSHFTQTLLYDLLVRSVYGHATDPAKYILYSGADLNHLRFAPTVAPEQWEALQLRNQLVALERLLTKIAPGDEFVPAFGRLRATHGKGFTERDFARFEAAYAGLSVLEKKYFNAFTGFIAREHWLAKVGEEGSDSSNGHAALWRNSFEEKQQTFSILSHLQILENRADQPEPCIIFQKTEKTHPLANFRVGDIAVLYPALDETDTVLHHQVIKCTIMELDKEQVAVQLRYRQHNAKSFETEGYWCLEPDFMDIGFAGMYRGLLEWAEAGREKREMVLGVVAPFNPTPDPSPTGRGVASPLASCEKGSQASLVNSTEHTTAPLPMGEGSGVGLNAETKHQTVEYNPLRKIGSFGQPQETASLDRWRYLKDFARLHRKFPTDAEKILWEALRSKKFHGIKFRRQHSIDEYVVDFVSLEHRLAVEVDGDTHALQADYDEQRTEYLGWFGFAVVRFTNDEVMKDLASVLEKLKRAIEKRKGELEEENARLNPTPDPSPTGRGVASPLASCEKGSQASLVNSTEHTTAPLPEVSGEGSGVGLNKITQSKNYFLLWGPPGTGKTSIMLRDLAAWVLNETSDNLLLLAYTNRAVDEICEALDSIGSIRHSLPARRDLEGGGEGTSDIRSQYLRIGGKHSTAERFREQLLNVKIARAKNRADLRAVLESHRIFVSTVASFGQNEGLLKLKKFQRLIVDEASQILEPQLIGLLTRFEHFTLIGDHRQLPAVTTQRPETTGVQDADLNSIGLCDLRDSYFERLYRRCVQQGWHWAYGQLDRQGRMHTEIMEFPNRHFYGNQLQALTQEDGHYQGLPLRYSLPIIDPVFEKIFAEKRVVFFPTAPEENLPNQKTNRAEGELVARLVTLFKHLWETNGKAWHPAKTLGIITPWRAQIAQLRESLAAVGLDPDELTIDTVERYQGGAREIIIISTCVNTEYQLASLVNLSGEGVDRKMNVALTRAREHLIMLGNEEILQKDERYRAFIAQYRVGYDTGLPLENDA